MPENAAIAAGEAAVFVRLNVTGGSPDTVAVTLYAPAVLLARGAGEAAMPEALVLTVTVFEPPKLELAPLAGAVNATETPASGFADASVTLA